jgi:heme oxygenase
MIDKNLSQKRYEEFADILHELAESLARIEERVEFFDEKLYKMQNDFDLCKERCEPDLKELFQKLTKIEFSDSNVSHSQLINMLHDIVIKLKALEINFEDYPYKKVLRELQNNRADLIQIKNELKKLEDIPTKVRTLESNDSSYKNKWKTFGWLALNVGMNLVWVLIASFLLYKLGISSPPTP